VDAEKINQAGGLPPYQQLAGILRRRIERGELAGRLPSEVTLGQQFGVSKSTVRKALRVLREAGLIGTSQGWGSRVLSPGERPGA